MQQRAQLAACLGGPGTRSPIVDRDFEPEQTLESRVDLSTDLSGIVPRTPVFKE
jgi:hypothetical protein